MLLYFDELLKQITLQIAAQPDFYPQVYNEVHEALITGYPYCVYYREELTQVVILSVFHTARDPAIWQSRA